jgi:3-hydroxyisobutyrate dehydrogenase
MRTGISSYDVPLGIGGAMRIGLVGLGRMGQGMGARLLSGGHELLVYNRTAGKSADLEKAGATAAPTVAAACKDREIVI